MKNFSERNAIRILSDDDSRKIFFGSQIGTYPVFVFLCGKQKSDNDNRDKLAKFLINKESFRYSVYSEEVIKLVDDIGFDLLSFEEILASISSKIVIILESYGSACELGAFSLLDKSISKLLVINNVLYKGNDSFIEKGPLLKIKAHTNEEGVLYGEFSKDGVLIFTQPLKDAIDKITHASFVSTPFAESEDKTKWIIADVGLAVCLLFEFVHRFGYLAESSIIDVMNALLRNKHNLPMVISLPTSNEIPEDKTNKFLLKIPEILCCFGLLERDSLKGETYYRVSSELIELGAATSKTMTSLIFKNGIQSTRRIRSDISKIRNQACKEGYLLWRPK